MSTGADARISKAGGGRPPLKIPKGGRPPHVGSCGGRGAQKKLVSSLDFNFLWIYPFARDFRLYLGNHHDTQEDIKSKKTAVRSTPWKGKVVRKHRKNQQNASEKSHLNM